MTQWDSTQTCFKNPQISHRQNHNKTLRKPTTKALGNDKFMKPVLTMMTVQWMEWLIEKCTWTTLISTSFSWSGATTANKRVVSTSHTPNAMQQNRTHRCRCPAACGGGGRGGGRHGWNAALAHQLLQLVQLRQQTRVGALERLDLLLVLAVIAQQVLHALLQRVHVLLLLAPALLCWDLKQKTVNLSWGK